MRHQVYHENGDFHLPQRAGAEVQGESAVRQKGWNFGAIHQQGGFGRCENHRETRMQLLQVLFKIYKLVNAIFLKCCRLKLYNWFRKGNKYLE